MVCRKVLRRLIVSNLAIVERAEAKFAPGLNVITGETGAGKSVLMGALGLVLGGRADASVVRDGAKEAEVEAEFEGTVIRRTVTVQGRSRAWVNDESVSVAELKEIGGALVDIHGPTANQQLMEETYQRETLDAFAEHAEKGGKARSGASVKARYASAFAALAALKSQLQALDTFGGEDELDMLRFQVNELESAELSEEDESIAERHAAAAHAEEIIENANAITDALGGDRSAADLLIRLQPRFREIAKHLPAAEEWASEAEDLTLKVQELSRTVADAISKLDTGDEDLDELDRRLTLINRLKRKYLRGARDEAQKDVGDVALLMQTLREKRAKLDDLEHRDEKIAELKVRIAEADAVVRKVGAELTERRRGAAEKVSAAVVRELRDLGFLQAKFFVALEPIEPEPHGMDRVVYMFEPNPGETARPLAAIASSGEIARVMLALKTCTSQCSQTSRASQTLVFDEIDANIGGEVGKVVGEKLRTVARCHQVIAITHLPQSAVYGERHLVVSKAVSAGRTRTRISEVEGESRVSEIARMLGGEKLTSVVRKHAEELLGLSR